MGFELELAHLQICKALTLVHDDEQRNAVIDHLKPKKLQDAVRETVDEAFAEARALLR